VILVSTFRMVAMRGGSTPLPLQKKNKKNNLKINILSIYIILAYKGLYYVCVFLCVRVCLCVLGLVSVLLAVPEEGDFCKRSLEAFCSYCRPMALSCNANPSTKGAGTLRHRWRLSPTLTSNVNIDDSVAGSLSLSLTLSRWTPSLTTKSRQ